MGAFLKALVGYNGNPSLLEVVAYWTYLGVVGWLFLRPQSMASLDEFAQVMREFPQTAILIQGYTDSSGSEQYNMQLSERRARSVYNHLALREVEEGRMAAIGYGEGYPVADNASPAGRAQNRRVSILVRGNA